MFSLESIAQLVLSLIPVVLMTALGWQLRQRAFLSEAFWPQAERLGYYVLLPSLLMHGLATARLDGLPVAGMAAALAASLGAVSLILLAARRYLPVSNAAFTSIFQGGIRFNNYVGMSVAAGLLGTQGVALAAVAVATIVPTVNVLCVLIFARYGDKGAPSVRHVLRQLMVNPLIVACAIGVVLHITRVGLPAGIEPMFRALGQASLPMGLLCVGAALDFSTVRTWLRPVAISSFAKFVVLPVVTLIACWLFGLEGPAALVVLMFQALPTASSSYIMAREMGGDAPLMAGIIACQTVLASLALPLVLVLLGSLL